jgi:uncharacterized protein (DUF302 family)
MRSERSPGSNGSSQRAVTRDQLVITKVSPWSMSDTVARLFAVLAARGMKVLAVIDHSDEARLVGLALRETKVILAGSPSISTPVIASAPLAALELPLRVVVWEDGYQTRIGYPSPAEVARRYGLEGPLAAALEGIDEVIRVVVDR